MPMNVPMSTSQQTAMTTSVTTPLTVSPPSAGNIRGSWPGSTWGGVCTGDAQRLRSSDVPVAPPCSPFDPLECPLAVAAVAAATCALAVRFDAPQHCGHHGSRREVFPEIGAGPSASSLAHLGPDSQEAGCHRFRGRVAGRAPSDRQHSTTPLLRWHAHPSITHRVVEQSRTSPGGRCGVSRAIAARCCRSIFDRAPPPSEPEAQSGRVWLATIRRSASTQWSDSLCECLPESDQGPSWITEQSCRGEAGERYNAPAGNEDRSSVRIEIFTQPMAVPQAPHLSCRVGAPGCSP